MNAEHDEWLEAVRAAHPEKTWLHETAKLDHEPQPWHELYFWAFATLQHDRQHTFNGSLLPVSYSAISTFARDHKIEGEDFRRFRICLTAIDAEYIAIIEERNKGSQDGHRTDAKPEGVP